MAGFKPSHTDTVDDRVPQFTVPPLDHSLTLPEIYAWNAEHSPKHPLFVFEETPGSLRTILWEEAAHGIDRAAKLCTAAVGQDAPGKDDARVIAVLGTLGSSSVLFFLTSH